MLKGNRKELDKVIREEFPLLLQYGDTAYLDNAATTQKPRCVIDAEKEYYETANANPLRGLYELSVKATDAYEDAREAVRGFLNAKSVSEVVFTRNASESLNLVAFSACEAFVKEGDEILITVMEHHSNLLPWMHAAKRKGAVLRYLEFSGDGTIKEEEFLAALTEKTKIVAMTQISNVLGIKQDIKTFAKLAHDNGSLFVADGAQSVPHVPVDVQDLDVDFLAFSGHKMLAPMGIGVLYGKEALLEEMPPFLTGGEMIEYVKRDSATYAELPHKFEAGTVNVGGAVGLKAAIDYYNRIGFDTIVAREDELSVYAYEKLTGIDHLHLLGSKDATEHHGIFTFTVDDVHPHDVAAILDSMKVNVRAGHHCAQPLMQFLKTPSTTRASLAFYNTFDEVDMLADALKTVRGKLGFS
ncbi:MAG: SufS family cysteine desulfurase [Lachnospiraceae bacterium]|nr:SufS family cysteine desulfurase [Lachnospiraceae bacterium]